MGVSQAVETALENIHLLHHHLDIEQVLMVGMVKEKYTFYILTMKM